MDSNLLKQACSSHIRSSSTHPCSTRPTSPDSKCHRIKRVHLTLDQTSPLLTCKTPPIMVISSRHSKPTKRKRPSYPTNLSNSSQATNSNKLSSKTNRSLSSSSPPSRSPSNSTRRRCASPKSWSSTTTSLEATRTLTMTSWIGTSASSLPWR